MRSSSSLEDEADHQDEQGDYLGRFGPELPPSEIAAFLQTADILPFYFVVSPALNPMPDFPEELISFIIFV